MHKIIPKESEEQKTLVQWLIVKKILFFAVPNGGSRHKLEAINLKKQGVIAGVSDIVVFLPDKILFIEMKRRKKVLKNGHLSITHTKVSKEQYGFLTRAGKFDYTETAICYGFKEAKAFIEKNL